MSENAPFFVDNEVIVLNREGEWVADGQEITHEPTRRLFARNLVREGDDYLIRVGRESKKIVVEDTPYFVHRIDGDPEEGYELWLSDDTKVSLDPATLSYKPGRLICRVATRIGDADAKFLRAPYFDLLRHLQEDEREYFLNFAGSRITIARK